MLKILIFLSGVIFQAGTANACGYCAEDKIAAVYDHAAITRSLGAGRTVVFFGFDAPAQASRAKIEKAAASVAGVDPASVRASLEPGALAIAFDPKRVRLSDVQKSLEARLAPLGLSLYPLHLMDRPGDLTAAGRR
jgi:hypothetical protein